MLYNMQLRKKVGHVQMPAYGGCIDFAFDEDRYGPLQVLCISDGTPVAVQLLNFQMQTAAMIGAYPYTSISNDDWGYDLRTHIYYLRQGGGSVPACRPLHPILPVCSSLPVLFPVLLHGVARLPT